MSDEIWVRLSTEQDSAEIEMLLDSCFGAMSLKDFKENICDRYLLAFIDNRLVGMTGLYFNKDYNGFEVDWTCTHPDYRKKGIMHKLFKRICALTDEDIYCSCWGMRGKDINLKSVMYDFGFNPVVRNRVTWNLRYNCRSGRNGDCIMSHEWANCSCYEDLYLRRAKH